MIEDEIDKLRDKLHFLIIHNEEYSKILKVSQELDILIVQYMGTENECNEINNCCSA
jgi:sulfur transfer protein SufE